LLRRRRDMRRAAGWIERNVAVANPPVGPKGRHNRRYVVRLERRRLVARRDKSCVACRLEQDAAGPRGAPSSGLGLNLEVRHAHNAPNRPCCRRARALRRGTVRLRRVPRRLQRYSLARPKPWACATSSHGVTSTTHEPYSSRDRGPHRYAAIKDGTCASCETEIESNRVRQLAVQAPCSGIKPFSADNRPAPKIALSGYQMSCKCAL
jgi:hypothetical protein